MVAPLRSAPREFLGPLSVERECLATSRSSDSTALPYGYARRVSSRSIRSFRRDAVTNRHGSPRVPFRRDFEVAGFRTERLRANGGNERRGSRTNVVQRRRNYGFAHPEGDGTGTRKLNDRGRLSFSPRVFFLGRVEVCTSGNIYRYVHTCHLLVAALRPEVCGASIARSRLVHAILCEFPRGPQDRSVCVCQRALAPARHSVLTHVYAYNPTAPSFTYPCIGMCEQPRIIIFFFFFLLFFFIFSARATARPATSNSSRNNKRDRGSCRTVQR